MYKQADILNTNTGKYQKSPPLAADRLYKMLPPWLFQITGDVIAFVLSYCLQFYIKFHSGMFETLVQPDAELVINTGVFMSVYWVTCFWFFGLYKNWYVRSPFDEFFTIFRASFIGNFIIFFLIFLDSEGMPRMLFLINIATVTLISGIGRIIIKRIQISLRKRDILRITSIIIGDKEKSNELFYKTLKSPAWGYRVLGYVVNDRNTPVISETNGESSLPVLGSLSDLPSILHDYYVREVLITMKKPDHDLLMEILSVCSDNNIVVKIVPDLYDLFTGLVRTLPLYGIPLIEVNKQLLKPWEQVLKRLLDIVFSAAVIVIGLPIWLLVSLLVKLTSPGPVFYKQVRVGKDEKNFEIIKFRSMVQDAEKGGPRWAATNDSRVTPIGRFLRKSHLDEIPQFWNVLKGDMSLVGPRPERPVFVEKFIRLVPYYKRRHIVRPGITGWWQVNYIVYDVPSEEELNNRLKDDFYYIENMSLKLDIEIIFRTVICVIKGHGQA